jgi:hypothetical protein
MPDDLAQKFMIMVMENLSNWPIKTAETFRNTVLGVGSVFAVNPLLVIPNDKDLDFMQKVIQDTVVAGRMIDFGFIPNEVLKQESLRCRDMFEENEFIHPYETWLGVSRWEGGMNGYFICPNPMYPKETLVIETYGVAVPNVADIILIYDMVSIEMCGRGNTMVRPAATRLSQSNEELSARGANSLDPLVTMLRLISDASIPIKDVPAPAKLNKQRAKQGKFIIPAHSVIDTKDYVALWTSKQTAHGTSKGKHHASPIAHWRRAHKRTLASGRSVPVRSAKVNFRETEELHRLFYRRHK